jgi:uncharacterized YigZ family protein
LTAKKENASPESDQYRTIRGRARSDLTVKGSKFIGIAAPAESEAGAEAIIEEIVNTYHDATHHCPAYRVGRGSMAVERCRDDGEPAGTAGKPILEALRHRHLQDVVCVVTRYFGGKKLGTGGLFRAYLACASGTLDAAGLEIRYTNDVIRILYPFHHTGIIMHLIDRFGGSVIRKQYSGSLPEIVVQIRRSLSEAFTREIVERTAGGVEIQREEVKAH